jgi:hypothetical protein
MIRREHRQKPLSDRLRFGGLQLDPRGDPTKSGVVGVVCEKLSDRSKA